VLPCLGACKLQQGGQTSVTSLLNICQPCLAQLKMSSRRRRLCGHWAPPPPPRSRINVQSGSDGGKYLSMGTKKRHHRIKRDRIACCGEGGLSLAGLTGFWVLTVSRAFKWQKADLSGKMSNVLVQHGKTGVERYSKCTVCWQTFIHILASNGKNWAKTLENGALLYTWKMTLLKRRGRSCKNQFRDESGNSNTPNVFEQRRLTANI
jgi:hypothetical protein